MCLCGGRIRIYGRIHIAEHVSTLSASTLNQLGHTTLQLPIRSLIQMSCFMLETVCSIECPHCGGWNVVSVFPECPDFTQAIGELVSPRLPKLALEPCLLSRCGYALLASGLRTVSKGQRRNLILFLLPSYLFY
jgi:hypothetical protein